MSIARFSIVLAAFATVGALSLTAACGSSSSGSSSSDTLKVGTLSDAKPVVYLENGRYTGFDNELLRAVADKEGLKLDFTGVEFSSLLSRVSQGLLDIGSSQISATDERRKTVDFTNGYEISYTEIATKSDSTITSIDQLAGKRIGVVQGSVQDQYATNKISGTNVVRFADYASAFTKLTNGGVDAVIFPQEIADKYIKDNGTGYKAAVKRADTETPAAWAVKKGNTTLLDKLNKGLAAVIADGTWLKLHDQWIPTIPVPDNFKPAK